MASVADLVEPDLLRERAGEYLTRAGEVLRRHGRVTLVAFEPVRVTATVADPASDEPQPVELAAAGDELSIRCGCPAGAEGMWCPHTVAVAIETWHRAPARRP